MATTFTLIESKTLSSTTATISFTSIPSTYTDLKIFVSSRSTLGADRNYLSIRFNNDTSNTLTYTSLYAVGSSASSAESGGAYNIIEYVWQPAANITANIFSNIEIYIPYYTSGNYKSISADFTAENNSSSGNTIGLNSSLWSDTSVISTITLGADGASLLSGSTFYLYGIKKS